MSRGTLQINSRAYSYVINIDQIKIRDGVRFYTLFVPINIEFIPEQKFDIGTIIAELRTVEKDIYVSECTHLVCSRIYSRTNFGMTFKFMISYNTIDEIEKIRKGNLLLSFAFNVQISFLTDIIIQDRNGKATEKSVVTDNHVATTQVQFEIEQSFWINKILKEIKFPSVTLVELPRFNQVVPPEYDLSIKEFEEASKYFSQGDYDKVVSHCRSAIEPFKRKLPELKEFIKTKSEMDWASNILNATDDWLDKVIKATSSFTSKTHHVPSVGHFGRTDAEIIMMITTGIIAYIGKLQFKTD